MDTRDESRINDPEFARERTELTSLELARQERLQEVVKATRRKPVLYFAEKDGVRAVLTGSGLAAAFITSVKFWDEEDKDTLFPYRSIYLFVPEEVRPGMQERVGTDPVLRKVAGTIDDLQKLVMLYEVMMVEVTNIFVPFMSNEKMSYSDQVDAVADCAGTDLYKDLVASQFRHDVRAKLLAL